MVFYVKLKCYKLENLKDQSTIFLPTYWLGWNGGKQPCRWHWWQGYFVIR